MYDTPSWCVYIEIGSTRKVTATCGRRVFKFKFELWICFLYRLAGHASTTHRGLYSWLVYGVASKINLMECCSRLVTSLYTGTPPVKVSQFRTSIEMRPLTPGVATSSEPFVPNVMTDKRLFAEPRPTSCWMVIRYPHYWKYAILTNSMATHSISFPRVRFHNFTIYYSYISH